MLYWLSGKPRASIDYLLKDTPSENIRSKARRTSLLSLLKTLCAISLEAATAVAQSIQLLDSLAISCAECLSIVGAPGEFTHFLPPS